MNCEQKKFRDFFGKEIKVGDNVLHLWATVTAGRFVTSKINHKKAVVVKFTPKGVGIEWYKGRRKHRSTIFNTRNRLIILADGQVCLDETAIRNETLKNYESYKKGLKTRISNLKKEKEWMAQEVGRLTKERELMIAKMEELTEAYNAMSERVFRFDMMEI